MDLKHSLPGNIWRAKIRDTWTFYCLQCKAHRKVPGRPNPWTLTNVGRIALTTFAFTLATFPVFGLKGLVAFIPFWMLFEVFHRVKFRGHVGCPHCGFDPFLYLTNVKRARQEIEQYWRTRFEEKGVPFPEKNAVKPANGVKPAEEPPASLEN